MDCDPGHPPFFFTDLYVGPKQESQEAEPTRGIRVRHNSVSRSLGEFGEIVAWTDGCLLRPSSGINIGFIVFPAKEKGPRSVVLSLSARLLKRKPQINGWVLKRETSFALERQESNSFTDDYDYGPIEWVKETREMKGRFEQICEDFFKTDCFPGGECVLTEGEYVLQLKAVIKADDHTVSVDFGDMHLNVAIPTCGSRL
jgi:hypothetical protein